MRQLLEQMLEKEKVEHGEIKYTATLKIKDGKPINFKDRTEVEKTENYKSS